ncbi:MAG TPA: FxsA family protein [Thermoleophilaceae bacterium]|nr:FxsA family protein [Thermoleophilaceae bacterium]
MPLLALILLFIAVPIAEIYVIIKVGEAIGAVPTVLLLVADSIVGSMLLRSQGRRAWARFRQTVERGAMPHREVLDGVLVIFGGAFLITPGFLTDVIGALLLLPPTRALFRRLLVRRLGRRIRIRAARPPRSGRPYDVDGTATEYDAPPPRLER